MAFQKSDVVLVPFPASDLISTKSRPAAIVSTDTFTSGEGRIIVAGITSNVAVHRNATSYELPDWAAAGLKKPSVVTAWMACVTPKLIMYKIGELSAADMAEMDQRLRVALGL